MESSKTVVMPNMAINAKLWMAGCLANIKTPVPIMVVNADKKIEAR